MFEHFYYEIIRKTIIAFGALFNNIYIKHKNNEGEVVSTIKVPLAYGPTQKFLARLKESPDLNKPIQVTTPRMSMEIIALSYNAQNKGVQTQAFVARDEDGKPRKSYLPVPYTLNLELSIFTKLEDDMFQIVEQVIPYFQPSYVVSITVVDEINEKRDIPFTLDNISMTDNYEGNFDERRALIWTLKFSAQIYFFIPISSANVTDSEIIKKVSLGFVAGDTSGNNPFKDVTYSVTPTATTNYTGTVVTTVATDTDDEVTLIQLTDTTNITEKTFISINGETIYVERIDNNDVIAVIRAVYGTTAQTHIAGSDVKNITTVDNNLIVYGDSFSFTGELI
jgi:hypothetical protein